MVNIYDATQLSNFRESLEVSNYILALSMASTEQIAEQNREVKLSVNPTIKSHLKDYFGLNKDNTIFSGSMFDYDSASDYLTQLISLHINTDNFSFSTGLEERTYNFTFKGKNQLRALHLAQIHQDNPIWKEIVEGELSEDELSMLNTLIEILNHRTIFSESSGWHSAESFGTHGFTIDKTYDVGDWTCIVDYTMIMIYVQIATDLLVLKYEQLLNALNEYRANQIRFINENINKGRAAFSDYLKNKVVSNTDEFLTDEMKKFMSQTNVDKLLIWEDFSDRGLYFNVYSNVNDEEEPWIILPPIPFESVIEGYTYEATFKYVGKVDKSTDGYYQEHEMENDYVCAINTELFMEVLRQEYNIDLSNAEKWFMNQTYEMLFAQEHFSFDEITGTLEVENNLYEGVSFTEDDHGQISFFFEEEDNQEVRTSSEFKVNIGGTPAVLTVKHRDLENRHEFEEGEFIDNSKIQAVGYELIHSFENVVPTPSMLIPVMGPDGTMPFVIRN